MGAEAVSKNGSRISRTAVIGAGVMGHAIAQVFARRGCPVMLYDIGEGLLADAMEKVRANLALYVEMGLENAASVEAVLSRINTTTDLGAAVADAQFITEAVLEDKELKKRIFREIAGAAPRDAILASNTSTLPLALIGEELEERDRLIITHWFNPPHLIPVVEVIRGESTSDETFERTVAFLKFLRKEPVHVRKPLPGFLVNRIQTAMFREIMALLEEGVASAEDIDKAVRGSFGLRLAVMGPLAVVDLGGVHLWHKGAQSLYPLLDASKAPAKAVDGHGRKRAARRADGQGVLRVRAGQRPADSKGQG